MFVATSIYEFNLSSWEYYCRNDFLFALNLVQKRFNSHAGIYIFINSISLLTYYVFLLELNDEIFT